MGCAGPPRRAPPVLNEWLRQGSSQGRQAGNWLEHGLPDSLLKRTGSFDVTRVIPLGQRSREGDRRLSNACLTGTYGGLRRSRRPARWTGHCGAGDRRGRAREAARTLGRRHALPASLVDVEVRIVHAGDDWWRVGVRVRNSGRSLVPETSYVDGRPIAVDLGGGASAEWYGSVPRSDAWWIDPARGLVLGPSPLIAAPTSARRSSFAADRTCASTLPCATCQCARTSSSRRRPAQCRVGRSLSGGTRLPLTRSNACSTSIPPAPSARPCCAANSASGRR